MEFAEPEITQMTLLNSPENLRRLIIKYLCGESFFQELSEMNKNLLKNLLDSVNKNPFNFNQFNELLLLLNQDIVKKGFFDFFFKKDKISLGELKQGIINFRGYAMLCFGNFRFAYKNLIQNTEDEIESYLLPYCKDSLEIIKEFQNRPSKMLDINKIPRLVTWLLGYIARDKIKKEAVVIREELSKAEIANSNYELVELTTLSDIIQVYYSNLKKIQKKGLKNTNIYLTWDYMDIYIATSMRNKWEFEETYDFIEEVFNNEKLKKLNLRYFDPTQSFCSNPRDKGILEGLMLKRALCTIYLAQESDTMGKDSELAATLVQSKPVIAYVPKINPNEYSKKIRSYPLNFFKKRFLILNAEGIFDDPEIEEILKKYDPNYEEIIQKFLDALNIYRQKQPISLWTEKDNIFKKEHKDFSKICNILAKLESYNFDNRAILLKERHPLSMQVDLESGVANGVLVVRTQRECANLLFRILTNQLKFIIEHKEYKNEVLNKMDGCTILKEEISDSPFRVVTDHEKLTNSFWNLWS